MANGDRTPMIPIPFRATGGSEGLPQPAYQTPGAAGMDLHASVEVELQPGERKLVPCGFSMAVPDGFEGQIRPRSGLASEHGVTVLNAPGTVDSDYRGEIKVLLANLGDQSVTLPRGSRIAQLVLARVHRIQWEPTQTLPTSTRGVRGFGHTGMESDRSPT
jgi:dUTP pyrophosphatase